MRKKICSIPRKRNDDKENKRNRRNRNGVEQKDDISPSVIHPLRVLFRSEPIPLITPQNDQAVRQSEPGAEPVPLIQHQQALQQQAIHQQMLQQQVMQQQVRQQQAMQQQAMQQQVRQQQGPQQQVPQSSGPVCPCNKILAPVCARDMSGQFKTYTNACLDRLKRCSNQAGFIRQCSAN